MLSDALAVAVGVAQAMWSVAQAMWDRLHRLCGPLHRLCGIGCTGYVVRCTGYVGMLCCVQWVRNAACTNIHLKKARVRRMNTMRDQDISEIEELWKVDEGGADYLLSLCEDEYLNYLEDIGEEVEVSSEEGARLDQSDEGLVQAPLNVSLI